MKSLIMSILFFMFFSKSVLAADFPITSAYGWRIDPINGEWKFHTGVDLGYEAETPIPALFNGTVISSGDYSDGYGNCVLIYHAAIDAYTKYGHCAAVFTIPGQQVVAGEIIAIVGNTGRSTGPHLHLEYIIQAEKGYEYSDPLRLWEK